MGQIHPVEACIIPSADCIGIAAGTHTAVRIDGNPAVFPSHSVPRTVTVQQLYQGRYWRLLQGSQAGRGTVQYAELAQQEGNDSAFDPSVVAIVEEAITVGILPPFRCA